MTTGKLPPSHMAPEPQIANSRTWHIYRILKQYGPATPEEIRTLLPMQMPLKQVKKACYNAMYRGFLAHDMSTGKYQIANIEYYDARNAIITERARQNYARRQRGVPDHPPMGDHRRLMGADFANWRLKATEQDQRAAWAAAWGFGGFIVGLIAGFWITTL